MNRYRKGGLLSLDDLESTVGLPVHRTLPNDFESVIESLSTGKPLVLHNGSQYTKELKALAADIAGQDGKGGPRKGPLLKRLFGNGRRSAVRTQEALTHA